VEDGFQARAVSLNQPHIAPGLWLGTTGLNLLLAFPAPSALPEGFGVFLKFEPMSRVNDAVKRLRSGKARYRIVLENDFE